MNTAPSTGAARANGPLNVPSDVSSLLSTFRLALADLLTTSNPKLAKTAGARSVIHHALPHRALARAINPATVAPTAPRGFIADLYALALETGTATVAARHNGCAHATPGCAAACLAGAGHGGLSVDVAACRGRRTLAMIADPSTYARAILWALCRELATARRDGLPLAFRLCGTDETPWFRRSFPVSVADAVAIRRRFDVDVQTGDAVTIADALSPNPDAVQYEYLKAPADAADGLRAWRAAGVDVTASFAADRATACADAIAAVRAGFRLAIPIAIGKGSPLPSRVLISANGQTLALPTVDGDMSDARWRDPRAVAVILREKRARGVDRMVADRFILPDAPIIRLADGAVQLMRDA
jgi:hypothetical protein